MDKKSKHLDIIQATINRLSSNSFALKGWAAALVVGIFALASKDADKLYFLVVYIPILFFWGLDAYYLLQERLYRSLYNKVCSMEEAQIDFCMNVKLDEFKSNKNTWINSLFSVTEWCFYLPLALVSAGIIILTSLL